MRGQAGGRSDPTAPSTSAAMGERNTSGYDSARTSGESSPMMMSPWNQTLPFGQPSEEAQANALVGSLVREEGHIYSLAAAGGLLYTGSDSKNIRVWRNLKEYTAFKANSGLVKAIVLSGNGKIFTGHQDGKIRIWKVGRKNTSIHKRSGTLPTLKDIFKSSMNPSSYMERRRGRPWIKHSDAVSCLSLNEEVGLLYSASWDRTLKVWRLSDSKCLESIKTHDDAVNSVVADVEDMVFTGSADGTVKVWRREQLGRGTKHYHDQTLLKQESAVTSLAVNKAGTFVYCGSSDGIVNYWDRDEDQLTHNGVLKGHKLAVLGLATAGNLLFTGSADKTICVWRREAAVHTCISLLTGHTGPVKCLAVEPDPEAAADPTDQRWIVYSGSLDKSVKVWRVSGHAPPIYDK